uniref:RING-type domain-containing protein n=1 Tax=Mycena chlorophos TaxID=658473 RepID=A0ABQ0KVG6_MYCCL|nr:predicted protein [Mycena chlorophos]
MPKHSTREASQLNKVLSAQPDGKSLKIIIPRPKKTMKIYPYSSAHGDRTIDAMGWQIDDAYTTDERPPETPSCELPEWCQLCGNFLSHPLCMRRCAHEFCYACIRERFKSTFVCYSCGKLATLPIKIEDSAELQKQWAKYYEEKYQWVDKSEVTYDFEGLIYPRRDLMYLDNDARHFDWPGRVYPEWEPHAGPQRRPF